MNLVRHWIRNFPEAQKSAIADAFEIGQPGKRFVARHVLLKSWIQLSAVRSWVWNYLAPSISSLSFRYTVRSQLHASRVSRTRSANATVPDAYDPN